MTFTTDQRDEFARHTTIDITTFGRRSGLPRRMEIWWFRVEDRFIITGTPGRRDWLANIRANPRLVVHVAGNDLEATASFVEDRQFRRTVFTQPHTSWYRTQEQLDELVASAPMIEVHF